MARDFDGVDDRITFGSDASIDGFNTVTISMWVERDAAGAIQCLMAKDRNVLQWLFFFHSGDTIRINQDFDVTNGVWASTVTVGAGGRQHIVVTYDKTSILNVPSMYIDGTADTVTTVTGPVGNAVSDATPNLVAGEAGNGSNDFDGAIGWLCYANAIWTAAQVNRARWWGTPGGAVEVYHPLVTDATANKGSATADASLTGTTMRSLPRVERNWGSMMGVGR